MSSDPIELGFITAVSQQAGMLNRPDASVMRMSEQPVPVFPLPFLSIFPLHSLKSLDVWKQTHAESNKQQPGANGSNLQGVVPLSAGPDQDTSMPWLHYERKKRNFSHGLAGICCNQGCTKNDIGRLCWHHECKRTEMQGFVEIEQSEVSLTLWHTGK